MVLASAIIAFLILLTALYVAAEFAAVGARRSRLRRLAEDGNALAARILPVVEHPHELDRYIAASQVGITLSSLISTRKRRSPQLPRSCCCS
jgi:putative hemolysin